MLNYYLVKTLAATYEVRADSLNSARNQCIALMPYAGERVVSVEIRDLEECEARNAKVESVRLAKLANTWTR